MRDVTKAADAGFRFAPGDVASFLLWSQRDAQESCFDAVQLKDRSLAGICEPERLAYCESEHTLGSPFGSPKSTKIH